MPDATGSTPPPAGQSPFEIVTPSKKKGSKSTGILIATLTIILLGLGIFFGVRLVQQSQEVREKAATQCVEQCPGADNILRNCTPPEADGTPEESTCSYKRIENCGGKKYCCPSAGSKWTTNLTLCEAPTPTPSPTVTPSPTATATAAATATPTSTVRATTTPTASAVSSTAQPIPETGTGWPTYLGIGAGVVVIIASMLLAI